MHRFFLTISRLMAIAGGFVLSFLVAVVVLSIIGRELNAFLHGDVAQATVKGFADWILAVRLPGLWGPIKLGPVNGDYEIVEAGIAFSIFSFLPLAQITGAHATVDVFTSFLPQRPNRFLTALAEVLFAFVLVIIALQLLQGMLSKHDRGQTTFLLQFPVWWAYAASLTGAIIAAIVSVYVALLRVGEFVTGRDLASAGEGEAH